MRQEDLFNLVVALEQRSPAVDIKWQGISLWPLIRQCLWAESLSDATPASSAPAMRRLLRPAQQAWRYLSAYRDFRVPASSDAETVFLSLPVCLQALPDGCLFDRIMDPLVASLPEGQRYEKLYVSPWPGGGACFSLPIVCWLVAHHGLDSLRLTVSS